MWYMVKVFSHGHEAWEKFYVTILCECLGSVLVAHWARVRVSKCSLYIFMNLVPVFDVAAPLPLEVLGTSKHAHCVPPNVMQ